MRKCASTIVSLGLALTLMTSCSGRRVDGDVPQDDSRETVSTGSSDQRVENVVSTLSRLQTRLEEMDARLSALTDKVDSTRIAMDNLTGGKAITTEAVGSAQNEAIAADVAAASTAPPRRAHSPDVKALLEMDSAITAFNKAMQLFKKSKYTDSELAFNHFTEQYPEHILAGSAQFYAGESYLMMGEYRLAINEYNKVISSFSSSPRVASALVRLAHCYEATGRTDAASQTMALARDLYGGNPSLDWASPARAQKTGTDLSASPMEPAEKH